jgi:two-component system, LuxR family, response regulator FixJ
MAADHIVHIIDDDSAVRESLAFLLSTADIAVKTYDSAVSFLDALPRVENGDCIVTDVRMPDISGIELLQRLQEKSVQIPVIVITGHGDVPLAVEAMKLGAVDFLEKPFDEEVLLSSVKSAFERRKMSEEQEGKVAEIQSRLDSLSQRERQVLDGLVAGNPNKTIAFDLGISPRTVEVYRANLMTKMNAASLSDLVRMAIVSGALATRES